MAPTQRTGSLTAALVALGLTAGLPIAGAGLPGNDRLHAAWADDDDDGGSPGGSPGGQPGGGMSDPGGGGEGWQRRQGANCFLFFCETPRRRAAPARRPAPEAREYVLWSSRPDYGAAISRAGFTIVARSPVALASGELIRVRAAPGISRRTALRRLAQAAPSATVAENGIYRGYLRPSGRRAGQGRPVTQSVPCARDVEVAMIDTGVNPAHPAIAGAAITQLSVRAGDRKPSSDRHGTAVASLLTGSPEGIAPGVAPGVKLIAIDAFHRDPSGADATDAYDLARALDLLSTRDVRLINLSLTGPDNPVLAVVVKALLARGKIIVAAAGNEGPKAKPLYPAAYGGVIAVTAIGADGKPWRRAASGDHIAFAAEGVDLALAGRDGKAEPFSGTSFAAPMVTAMLAGKLRGAPASDVATFEKRLAGLARDQGAPGRDPVFGYGVVQPRDACL